jgi:hypothetical protein
MSSAIDPTKPAEGNATTLSVRNNFAAAKDEIEALQADAGGALRMLFYLKNADMTNLNPQAMTPSAYPATKWRPALLIARFVSGTITGVPAGALVAVDDFGISYNVFNLAAGLPGGINVVRQITPTSNSFWGTFGAAPTIDLSAASSTAAAWDFYMFGYPTPYL